MIRFRVWDTDIIFIISLKDMFKSRNINLFKSLDQALKSTHKIQFAFN